jgi:hypothetical protein
LIINYDGNPKHDALIRILSKAEAEFRKSDDYDDYEALSIRRLHKSKKKIYGTPQKFPISRGKESLGSIINKEAKRQSLNRSILVAVKTLKLKCDIQRLLITHFVKSNSPCKLYYEEKLR